VDLTIASGVEGVCWPSHFGKSVASSAQRVSVGAKEFSGDSRAFVTPAIYQTNYVGVGLIRMSADIAKKLGAQQNRPKPAE